jgi:hypothetical protein
MMPVEVLREKILNWAPPATQLTARQIEEEKSEVLMRSGNTEYKVTQRAFIDIAQMCGIPGPYAAKCPVQLIIPHINYWASRSLKDLKMLVSNETVVEAFVKPNVEFIPPSMVLSTVERAMGVKPGAEAIGYDKASFDIDYCHMAIVQMGKPFGVGDDTMNGGVTIQYSPSGKCPLVLGSYLLKLVCTNGMVAPVTLVKWQRRAGQGGEEGIYEWIEMAAGAAYDALKNEHERLMRTKEVGLTEHVGEVMNSIFSTYKVPADIRDLITDRVLNTGATTVYDVIDAMTYVISHDPEVVDNAQLQVRLMTAAGRVAAHPDVCPSCHRVMPNGAHK